MLTTQVLHQNEFFSDQREIAAKSFPNPRGVRDAAKTKLEQLFVSRREQLFVSKREQFFVSLSQ
jgi:hypothetical protein